MRSDVAIGLLALFAAACGGATVVGVASDASSDASVVADGGAADGSSVRDGFAGFEGGTVPDALTSAQGQCDPPCADGEYCYTFINRGGGRISFGPVDGDASIGCHPVPTQCAPAATCSCLLQVVGPECHATTTDCVRDDAGAPTVECIFYAP